MRTKKTLATMSALLPCEKCGRRATRHHHSGTRREPCRYGVENNEQTSLLFKCEDCETERVWGAE